MKQPVVGRVTFGPLPRTAWLVVLFPLCTRCARLVQTEAEAPHGVAQLDAWFAYLDHLRDGHGLPRPELALVRHGLSGLED